MKGIPNVVATGHVRLIPVYEVGRLEPVGYLHSELDSITYCVEYRCGFCGCLVVEDKDHCPSCGAEY